MSKIEPLPQAECQRLFQEHLYQLDPTQPVPVQSIASSLETAGVCCLRGLVTAAEVTGVRERFRDQFSRDDDRPGVGESQGDVQRNFQKLRVGISPPKPMNSRLVRTIYNPLWDEDLFGMHALFRRMIRVRNALLGAAEDFALTQPEQGLWTAARLQHYPRGGGFMSAHRDELIIDATADRGLDHFQLLLMLSQKGVDYQRGGGFTIRDERFVDTEQFCELGDMVVYDSRSVHGVDTIDPQEMLDLETTSGRLVAFVTLYRDLTG
ncbi:MAG: hypothetical protein CL681_16205 [Blastopirellula sp.]|nr:hypothetical protein [Blastopirellula sp.]